eukprot:CAMPEP_0175381688 /NCGR_PEP_ID=MMETSP0095-20121207/26946_1 /TAXON_ID=311494 /ORGANISM="Alexandrium monilatum, Strain CCMP3105" /LENGTH=56 /DNA_ID=CAMNT_0016680063 /DNA_START=1 /DNA_END=171 /DNA_ORIENTATION=-
MRMRAGHARQPCTGAAHLCAVPCSEGQAAGSALHAREQLAFPVQPWEHADVVQSRT